VTRRRRTVRLTVLFKGREEWATWDVLAAAEVEDAAPFDIYTWKHSNIEHALHINVDEIQALHIERQAST
jgi:hypothetical protein